MSAAPACSCGEREPHRVGRRTTSDGIIVSLWSDGWVTCRMGTQVGKLPHATMWQALDEVCLLAWSEVRPFIREWKRAVRLAGATAESARAEAHRRLRATRKAAKAPAEPSPATVAKVLAAAGTPVYRETVTTAGVRVFLRIR